MKIYYKGEELDPETEWELINTEKGFLVLCKLNKDYLESLMAKTSSITYTEEIENRVVYCNITEIHNRFKSFPQIDKIAFESDIHTNGCAYSIDVFEIVYIYDAEEIYDGYYGDMRIYDRMIRQKKLERIVSK